MLSRALDRAGSNWAASAVLLGGYFMAAAGQDADRSSGEERVDRALALLGEALQIIDELGDAPDLAARLDEVIERLKERARKAQG